jgi:hypothetical protein
MIVTSFFIYFVIFPTIAFVSFPSSLNVSLKQGAPNEEVILIQTNASTAENEITEGDGGDAIGGRTGTARGGDGGDGGDAIGTSSCSEVLGGNGGNGGTAAAGTDVEIGREGKKGATGYCEILDPDDG